MRVVILIILVVTSLFSVCPSSSALSPTSQSSDYLILKVNLHAHTNYSDGTYNPSELVDIYKNAGYDVLGITDHDTMAGCAEALAEAHKVGLTVICGEEITCSWSDGSWKHVLALFTSESVGISEGSTVEVREIFDAIHAQSGIGIVAHPWYSWNNWQAYTNETYIDGWEVDYSMAWILQSDYIYLIGHDFHNSTFLELLPNYYTYVLAQNRTEAGVKEALLEKRIVVYGDGKLYGSSPALGLYFETLATPSPVNPTSILTPTPPPITTPTLTPAFSSSPLPSSPNEQTSTPGPIENSTFVLPSVFFVESVLGIALITFIVLLFRKKKPKVK